MRIVHVADFHGIETGNPSEIISGKIIKNEDDIVDKINLLKKNKELRSKIGKSAKETAIKYDWEIIIDKLERIYEKLCKDRNKIKKVG